MKLVKKTLNWIVLRLPHREFVMKKLLPRIVSSFPVSLVYYPIYTRIARKKTNAIRYSTLVIEPFNVCNLQCTMCAYANSKREKTSISMDLFKKIIDDAKIVGIKTVCFSYFNEPFLDKHIFERVRYTKNAGLSTSIITNGCLMDKKIIDEIFDSDLDSILISLDGYSKETYLSIRKGSDFEQVNANVKLLIDERKARERKKPRITLGYVMQKKNETERSHFQAKWGKLVEEIAWGQPEEFDTAEDIKNRSGVRTKKLSIAIKKGYICWNFFNNLTVRSDGKVVMCCSWLFDDEEHVLGDLNKQSIMEIWNSERVQKLVEMIRNCDYSKIYPCNKCYGPFKLSTHNWWFADYPKGGS